MFARRPAVPELALTSTAELEADASAACLTYHHWLRALLTAGVGTHARRVDAQIGREATLLESNEAAFGPMVEVLWYRGPIFAAVQVQFRRRAAAAEAHRLALLFAGASDVRLRRILAAA
jgi:hypothetical protein